jgi:DNA-directed RNA polymerase specialized sigma24 family protein
LARPDEAEFAAFVHRQSRFVFRVAHAVLRNSHDAEDIVQEVFLKLYRRDASRELRNEQAFLARMSWSMEVDRLPKHLPKLKTTPNRPQRRRIRNKWRLAPTGRAKSIA